MENKDNGETPVRFVSNEGIVEVTQEGPVNYVTGELGVNMQLKEDNPVKLKIGTWKTHSRDFSQTHDLFVCQSACFDLSELNLILEDGGVLPDVSELVYQLPVALHRGDTCIISK